MRAPRSNAGPRAEEPAERQGLQPECRRIAAPSQPEDAGKRGRHARAPKAGTARERYGTEEALAERHGLQSASGGPEGSVPQPRRRGLRSLSRWTQRGEASRWNVQDFEGP